MTVVKFDYIAPKKIEEVVEILHREGKNAFVMAGGTDLLVKIQRNLLAPKLIIGLRKIKNLNRINFDNKKGLTIGATVLLSQITKHDKILEHYPTIASAARATANTQVRNMGTIVGNICNASPSADNVPILLAMKAILNVIGPKGHRNIDLEHFFLGPGSTALTSGEVVTSVFVPIPKTNNYGTAYCHISQRGKIDCAAIGVGTMLVVKNNKILDINIFVGACAPTPVRALKAEQILKGVSIKNMDKRLIYKASLEVLKNISPISDIRASAEYRKKIVGVISERAITKAKEMVIRKTGN